MYHGAAVYNVLPRMTRSTKEMNYRIIIKSRANILTRVQSKAYSEPSSFSSLFNFPYSKDIHYFIQARHIAHSTT